MFANKTSDLDFVIYRSRFVFCSSSRGGLKFCTESEIEHGERKREWRERKPVCVCVCYPLRWEKRTHEPLISEGIFILFYLLKSAGAFEFRNYYNNSSPRRDQKWCGRERKRMGSWLIFRAEFVVGFGSVWALNSPEPIRRSLYRCFTWSGKIFAILNNLAQLW